MKKFSTRQLKVGQTIKAALSEILMRGDIYDPETFEQLSISVSEVQISVDMHYATVFFVPLGGKNKHRMEKALNPMAPQLQKELRKKLHMKFLPKLNFKLDTTFDEAEKISTLLFQGEFDEADENNA
jgi:ribosome-binding factor A